MSVRGTARVTEEDPRSPEYSTLVRRYLGEDQVGPWVERLSSLFSRMVRIAVRPEWVAVIDFQTRWPSAIERAVTGRQSG